MAVYASPLFGIVLGAALGIVDVFETSASNFLRLPALIAALILVGQAFLDFRRISADVAVVESTQHAAADSTEATEVEVVPVELGAGGQVMHHHTGSKDVEEVTVVTEDQRPIFMLMALATWLGWATLTHSGATPGFLLLCLVAAFRLFSDAWQMLRAGTD